MFTVLALSIGNPRAWWIAILIGLVLLTLSLFVLARLRWIQSRPFSTCIALSVFAHILLIAAVLLSRIFDDIPRPPGAAPMRITISEPADSPRQIAERPRQPWLRLASQVPPVPTADEPPRQEADLTPQVVRTLPDLVEGELPVAEESPAVESLPQPPPALDNSKEDGALPAVAAPALLGIVATPQIDSTEEDRDEPLPAADSIAEDEGSLQDGGEGVSAEPNAVEVDDPAATEHPDDESFALAGDANDSSPDSPADPEDDRVASQLPSTADSSTADSSTADSSTADSSTADSSTADSSTEDGDPWVSVGVDQLFPVAPATEERLANTTDRNSPSPWQPAKNRDSSSSRGNPLRRMDGAAVPREYQLRMREDRLQVALARGANKRSEQAVKAALYWLAKNQMEDGRWDPPAHGAGRGSGTDPQSQAGAGRKSDTGITGLALLALLGAGHTQTDGKYQKSVQVGLEYLLRQQAADGSLAGQAGMYDRMYCHGMATLALSEAVAMTGDPRLAPFLKRAIDYTARSQNPSTGGWRYWPGDRGDTSQLGWQLLSVVTAESAGVSAPRSTRLGMETFLSSVSSGRGRLASYRPGELPTRSMTAEALVCHLFLGNRSSPASVDEAVGFIMQETPRQGQVNYYYWYYATLALSLLDDEDWPVWNRGLQDQLLSRQRKDDPYSGSWDPDSRWGAYGGRVFTTALATLSLEVYYRYLPKEQDDGVAQRRPSIIGRR